MTDDDYLSLNEDILGDTSDPVRIGGESRTAHPYNPKGVATSESKPRRPLGYFVKYIPKFDFFCDDQIKLWEVDD